MKKNVFIYEKVMNYNETSSMVSIQLTAGDDNSSDLTLLGNVEYYVMRNTSVAFLKVTEEGGDVHNTQLQEMFKEGVPMAISHQSVINGGEVTVDYSSNGEDFILDVVIDVPSFDFQYSQKVDFEKFVVLRQFTVGDQELASETSEFSATVGAPIFADEDY